MVELNLYDASGRKFSAAVPESWDELTGAQLIAVANILYKEMNDVMRRDLRLTKAICSLKWEQMQDIPHEVILEQLLPLTEWILEGCSLTAQLLPVLKVKEVTYYGPKSHLQNMRFAEFDAAERALYDWHCQPEDMGLLYEFIAILYRRQKPFYDTVTNPDGDIRAPFNGNLTQLYAKDLHSALDEGTAFAILLWYKGCRQYITDRYPAVFTSGEADKSEVPGEPAYFGLIRGIAKEGIYGTYEQVEQLYIYNAFEELEEAAAERERLEEAMAEARATQPA